MGKIHLWDISAIIAQVCFKYPSIVFEGNHFFHSDITCLSSVSQLSLKYLSIKRCSVFEHFLKHQWHGHQLSLTCLSTGCRSDGRRSATFARPSVSSKQTSITDCFNFRSSCFDLDSVQVSVFGLVRFDLESLDLVWFELRWVLRWNDWNQFGCCWFGQWAHALLACHCIMNQAWTGCIFLHWRWWGPFGSLDWDLNWHRQIGSFKSWVHWFVDVGAEGLWQHCQPT